MLARSTSCSWLATACLVACAAPRVDPVPPLTSAAPSPPAALAVAAAAPPLAVASSSPVLPFEEERRALLDELVAVDTSHGHETDAARIAAAHLERAGLHAEVIESAPGRGNVVARVRGNGSKRPLLLVAHLDVVPVEGQSWTVPPFHATQREGFLWGRGVSDDKGMASALVAIAIDLARSKAPLSRDVIIALTAGEETDAIGIRDLLKNHHDVVDAELALNEGGGAITSDDLSHVVGVGVNVSEKIFQSYTVTAHGRGGHSSVPATDEDPAATLGQALVRIGTARREARVLPDAKDALGFFASRAREPLASALRRAAQSGRLSTEDERVLSKDPLSNAMIRTTCVTTMLRASPQDNVLPTDAVATVNCRLLPDERPDAVEAWLQKVVADPRVRVDYAAPVTGDANPRSTIDPRVMDAVRAATTARWPGAPVFPMLTVGSTDSLFLRAAGIASYGVDTTPTSVPEDEEGRTGHAPDERAPLRWLDDGVRFLRDVVLTLAR